MHDAKELADYLAGRTESLNLDHAALLLATLEFPDLDPAPFLALLDSHAAELRQRIAPAAGGPAFVAEANRYLFDELGFHGNTADYYNPANSCLNQVLAARTGIPITLSVVYLEIARRLERPLTGIGLRGHFVIRYDDGDYCTYIDAFHGGRLLDAVACLDLARQVAGAEAARRPGALAPVTNRQILLRMVHNLRGIYFSRRAHRKALEVLDLLVAAHPDSAEEYKQRGLVRLQLEQARAARADFERYVALAPDAADRAEIEEQLVTLKRYGATLN